MLEPMQAGRQDLRYLDLLDLRFVVLGEQNAPIPSPQAPSTFCATTLTMFGSMVSTILFCHCLASDRNFGGNFKGYFLGPHKSNHTVGHDEKYYGGGLIIDSPVQGRRNQEC